MVNMNKKDKPPLDLSAERGALSLLASRLADLTAKDMSHGLDVVEMAEKRHVQLLIEAGLCGRSSAIMGDSLITNPFDPGSEEYRLWRDCWMDAFTENDKDYT